MSNYGTAHASPDVTALSVVEVVKDDRRRDPRTTAAARAMGHAEIQRRAEEAIAEVVPVVVAMYRKGMPFAQIAASLNEDGRRTRFGAAWDGSAVRRVLVRKGLYGEPGAPSVAERRCRQPRSSVGELVVA